MERVLVIPTIDVTSAKRCVSSFYPGLEATKTFAAVIYNGSDKSVETVYMNDRTLLIGASDSDRIATAFSFYAGCNKELLFGDPSYGRSFGGASNLALAIAMALGAKRIAKIDDDCLEDESVESSWLERSLRFVSDPTAVHYGHSTGQQSGSIDRLPVDTARQLAGFFYTPEQREERLGGKARGYAIKNGILSLAALVARRACYPVMFEPRTATSLRGEVYLWKDALSDFGISFAHHQEMSLVHRPTRERSLNSWLYSTVLGIDLWFVLRYRTAGHSPNISERKASIQRFCEWISKATWPAEVDVPQLVRLAGNQSMLVSLTNRILAETKPRLRAWRRLMTRDINKTIKRLVPTVSK